MGNQIDACFVHNRPWRTASTSSSASASALSVSSLPVNTYGVDYAGITKTINPNVYTSGWHYIGFMHKFIEYPSSVQTMDFARVGGADRGPIEARSIDGLMVTFSAQF